MPSWYNLSKEHPFASVFFFSSSNHICICVCMSIKKYSFLHVGSHCNSITRACAMQPLLSPTWRPERGSWKENWHCTFLITPRPPQHSSQKPGGFFKMLTSLCCPLPQNLPAAAHDPQNEIRVLAMALASNYLTWLAPTKPLPSSSSLTQVSYSCLRSFALAISSAWVFFFHILTQFAPSLHLDSA
jgi:hypothetical protein